MATVKCIAKAKGIVKSRGKATIEYYDKNNNPVYGCYGWQDCSTETPIKECEKCKDFVGNIER